MGRSRRTRRLTKVSVAALRVAGPSKGNDKIRSLAVDKVPACATSNILGRIAQPFPMLSQHACTECFLKVNRRASHRSHLQLPLTRVSLVVVMVARELRDRMIDLPNVSPFWTVTTCHSGCADSVAHFCVIFVTNPQSGWSCDT